MADMLVDLVVAWHCKTWWAWCSWEPGDGFFNNRASTFSCNSKLCSRDSYGLKTWLVAGLLQCPYLHSSHNNLPTCCLEYELFPWNIHAFWSNNVYVGHIFCCGPSILHMPSSSLQASSLLSSRQPGTVCRNIQTCSKVFVKLSLHRNRTRNVELNQQACPFLTPAKKNGSNLITRVLVTCNYWLNLYHKFRVIADVLAVLACAPRSSMQLHATREWPAVGSF